MAFNTFTQIMVTEDIPYISTSMKHRMFVSELIGDKPVSAIPGIDRKAAIRLSEHGLANTRSLLGKWLMSDRDDFVIWIKGVAGINRKQAADVVCCLHEWAKIHI